MSDSHGPSRAQYLEGSVGVESFVPVKQRHSVGRGSRHRDCIDAGRVFLEPPAGGRRGPRAAMALTDDFQVFFWGNNNHGQSGLGTEHFGQAYRKIEEPVRGPGHSGGAGGGGV